jgi:hypothetical protein
MADNVEADAGTGGAVFATDDVGGVHYPISKLAFGALDAVTLVEVAAGLPVNLVSATSLTVTAVSTVTSITNVVTLGTISNALPTGTNTLGTVNLGTLAAPLTVVGSGAEDTALRVTIATNSSGVISVDDNDASITVDGTVAVSTVTSVTNVVAVAAVSTVTSVTNVVNVDAVSTVTSVTNVVNVAAVSTVTSVSSVAALPARSRTVDSISAALATGAIMNGLVELTPKFASGNNATTAALTLIAAVSDKTLRVLSLQLVGCASTNAVYIGDGTANLYGTSTYKIPLDVSGATGPAGLTLPFNPLGWFQTAATNRPIVINVTNASSLTAIASYVEV